MDRLVGDAKIVGYLFSLASITQVSDSAVAGLSRKRARHSYEPSMQAFD